MAAVGESRPRMYVPHTVQATGALWRYMIAADFDKSKCMISMERVSGATDRSPNGANHGTVKVNIGDIIEPRSQNHVTQASVRVL